MAEKGIRELAEALTMVSCSLPGITAESVAGIVPGIVVFGDSVRVSPGLLREASGLIALLIGVILVARSPDTLAAAPIPPPRV